VSTAACADNQEEGVKVDTARSDAVEAEISRLIEKRASRATDPDEREELWKESVRLYNARRRDENRLAWAEYHQAQAERHRAVLEGLISDHEARAEMYRLRAEGGR